MGKNIPRLKGIRTPYFLATILGFIDRKTKSAGIDPETKKLTSGWITRKQRQFSAYLNRMKEALENAAQTIQAEADCLMNELAYLPTSVPPVPQMRADSRGEGPEARAAAREHAALSKQNREAKADMAHRKEILHRLVEIRNDLTADENMTCNALDATGAVLSAMFCAYGRGALGGPVMASQISDITFDHCAVLQEHFSLRSRIESVLNKEEVEE